VREDWQDKDFYAVLAVDPSASPIEIRRAYRAAARDLGDTGSDDPRRAELDEAYAVLRDATLRAEYDGMEPTAGTPGAREAGGLSPMRKWGAIGAGTVVATIGYTGFVAALVGEETVDTTIPFVALLVMIASHVPVALISRHPERWMAAGKGMGVTAVVGTGLVALGVLFPVAAVGALGFGGLFSYSQESKRYRRPRILWVSGVALYTLASLYVVPDFGIVLAPIFPFNALGISDHFVDRRARRATG
jgi:hypothetical protein